jgi:hypothetical protein
MKSKKSATTSNKTPERPLDPTRNARDILGDTAGRIGITIGSPKQTSAEPEEPNTAVQNQDDTQRLAGINNKTQTQPVGIPKEEISNKIYDKHTSRSMSDITYEASLDNASEKNNHLQKLNKSLDEMHSGNNTTASGKTKLGNAGSHNQKYTPVHSIDVEDEESQEASAPDTEQINNKSVLERAQEFGTYMDRTDEDNAQEVDTANQVDKAEQSQKTH